MRRSMNYAGLDLGKMGDPSALAVVQREELLRPWEEASFCGLLVRYLERIPLGTPYTAVVERVREVATHPLLSGGCLLTVDATGVGVPVVDMLRGSRMPCGMTAVTITGREKAHGKGDSWHVPKRDLLNGLQVLIERKELRIAKRLRESRALVKELIGMRMNQRPSGVPRFGADGSGEHDDLVLALALVCWQAMRPKNGFGGQRLPGI
ncbi:MAG TPA: hypothetical protein VM120_23530 [Bryobacteraceae bacterium]|nr:hypothetical protein [Bryobacteraceae bacterium]